MMMMIPRKFHVTRTQYKGSHLDPLHCDKCQQTLRQLLANYDRSR